MPVNLNTENYSMEKLRPISYQHVCFYDLNEMSFELSLLLVDFFQNVSYVPKLLRPNGEFALCTVSLVFGSRCR